MQNNQRGRFFIHDVHTWHRDQY